MSKPTLFVVLDIETTLRKRIAFDVAWTITDRKGGDFGSGSFVIREAFARFLDRPFDLLDIWAYWGQSVPLTYTAPKTASGKFLSTSAESAFRFENQEPDFVERHIAWHDVQIEKQILLRALGRRKALNTVRHPSKFRGAVWRDINKRLGIAA